MSTKQAVWLPSSDVIRERAVTAAADYASRMQVWDRWDEAEYAAVKSTAILTSGRHQITIIVPYVMMGIVSGSPLTAESQADRVGTAIADFATDDLDIPSALVTYEGAGVTLLTW